MTIAPVALIPALSEVSSGGVTSTPTARGQTFANMMFSGLDRINDKMLHADALAESFALDDSIPPHQVLFALDQAHQSFAMMMQVRSRLVEGYQEIMRMQL